MSVRFFKILSGVFLAHLIVFSVVWVGFSAPFPRPLATFTYQGALPGDDHDSGQVDVWQKTNGSDQFILDHSDQSELNHWTILRGPSK
jgi:hypothetical protein